MYLSSFLGSSAKREWIFRKNAEKEGRNEVCHLHVCFFIYLRKGCRRILN